MDRWVASGPLATFEGIVDHWRGNCPGTRYKYGSFLALEFPGAGRWHLDATAANVRPVDARTDVDSDAGPRRTALGPSESAARRARPAGAA
jgi:hypothetical protein